MSPQEGEADLFKRENYKPTHKNHGPSLVSLPREQDMDQGWKKAKEIYEMAKPHLEGRLWELMAIDIESGDYFLGKTTSEAHELAAKKHPDKIFYILRVGARAAYSFGTLALDETFPGNRQIHILRGLPRRGSW